MDDAHRCGAEEDDGVVGGHPSGEERGPPKVKRNTGPSGQEASGSAGRAQLQAATTLSTTRNMSAALRSV